MRNHRRAQLALVAVLAVVLVGAVALVAPVASASNERKDCAAPPSGLVPLTDMAGASYQGHEGGLYPGGGNEPPDEHLQLGLELAGLVVPRSAGGEPDPIGVIGLVSVGVSNTNAEFDQFMRVLATAGDVAPAVVPVNGARGSAGLARWAEGPDSAVWRQLDAELDQAGVAAPQVQAAWVKVPSDDRGTPDLAQADGEIADLGTVVRQLKARFPNLQVAYLASRIYGGWAGGEPKAYQHGFTIKWLIEDQIEGDPQLNADPAAGEVVAPWLAWGPYLWADGPTPRGDGLQWDCTDFEDDGVHPGPGAAEKVAGMLLDFFSSSPTTASWFTGSAPSTPTTSSATTPTSHAASTAAASVTSPGSSATPSSEVSTTPTTPPGEGRDTAGLDFTWLAAGAGLLLVLGLVAWRFRPEARTDQDEDRVGR